MIRDLVHLEISLFGALLIVKLNEGVLEAVARFLVLKPIRRRSPESHRCKKYLEDLTRSNLAEAGKDKFEVVVRGERVKLAHKEHGAVGLDLRVRNVSKDLKHLGTRSSLDD